MSHVIGNAVNEKKFDYIVVGGGSAGCVMATRLSEDGTKSVLLIEAGPSSDVEDPSSPLRDASRLVLEGYNWDYEARLQGEDRFTQMFRNQKTEIEVKTSARKPFAYRVGKVLGGSSAVNGAVALRGFPSDFDQWATMGCPNWSWGKVLPWFCHMETDVDLGELDTHGDNGPMRLRRPRSEELHPLDAAFSDACQACDIPYTNDLNVGEDSGVGLVPANVGEKAERYDVYRSYLAPSVERGNLRVISGETVGKIRFEGTKAIGVSISKEGKLIDYGADHVVVCAGAIGSAALLQRSGIGEAQHLKTLGIPVIADSPAVGNNLLDHTSLVLWALPKAGVCQKGLPWRQVAARIASGYDSKVDVQIGLLNNVDSSTVPKFKDRVAYPMLVGASAMLMRPDARGRVFITSKDPEALAEIDLPIRGHEEDTARLVGAIRKIWQVLKHPEVDKYLDGILFWSESMINNDVVMHSAIKNLVNPGWHASGTVRMGAQEDPDTAAAEDGRVFGVEGVTVADASLFPTIPSMPTNLTTIMMAERIASFLLAGGIDER